MLLYAHSAASTSCERKLHNLTHSARTIPHDLPLALAHPLIELPHTLELAFTLELVFVITLEISPRISIILRRIVAHAESIVSFNLGLVLFVLCAELVCHLHAAPTAIFQFSAARVANGNAVAGTWPSCHGDEKCSLLGGWWACAKRRRLNDMGGAWKRWGLGVGRRRRRRRRRHRRRRRQMFTSISLRVQFDFKVH